MSTIKYAMKVSKIAHSHTAWLVSLKGQIEADTAKEAYEKIAQRLEEHKLTCSGC